MRVSQRVKKCTTISGAIGSAVAAGVIGGIAATITLLLFARPYAGIGAVVACLVIGFVTLLLKYPRWEADI
jgi:hypothetical protein